MTSTGENDNPGDPLLDARGKACPLPILMTAKALLRLEVGEILEVIGDDPAIAEDMPVYCYRAGHRLLSLQEDEETSIIRCRDARCSGVRWEMSAASSSRSTCS